MFIMLTRTPAQHITRCTSVRQNSASGKGCLRHVYNSFTDQPLRGTDSEAWRPRLGTRGCQNVMRPTAQGDLDPSKT